MFTSPPPANWWFAAVATPLLPRIQFKEVFLLTKSKIQMTSQILTQDVTTLSVRPKRKVERRSVPAS